MKIDKKLPSIRNLDISNAKGFGYEAFVYEIINIQDGKKYIGYHSEPFDGSYWGSPTDKYFLDILYSGDRPLLDYKIVATGLKKDMQNLESKLLSEVKAKSNPDYYNKAVAPSGNKALIQVKVCLAIVKIINDKIKNKDWRIEDKDKIYALDRLQVRAEDDVVHIQKIKDRAEQTGIEHTKPVIIWGGASPKNKGQDVVGDGNHTLRALNQLPKQKKVRTIYFDEAFIREHSLTEDDLRYIGNLLNPKKTEIDKENEPNDIVKLLVGLKEKGQDLNPKNTSHAHDYLKPLGYLNKDITKILQTVEQEYLNKQYKKGGKKVAIYSQKTHPENWKELMKRKKELEDEDTIVICHCTTYYSKIVSTIFEEMKKPENRKKYIIQVLLFHNSDRNKKEWEKKWGTRLTEVVQWVLDEMEPVEKNYTKFKYQLKSEPMPHTMRDVS